MDSVQQLMTSCEQGDVDTAQAVLDEGLGVDTPDEDENTALMVAAGNGHDQVVRLLLMRGASVDKTNLYGWTPVMQAARHGHANIVSLLLQHPVDINATNSFGASALMLAARGGHLQVAKLLVEAGIDINGSSQCEYTPLMTAAQQGHDAVLRLLLDRGSDVNYRTPSTGVTPLMLASLNGHMTTAQILIERGGDPNIINGLDHTALTIAAIRGKREVRGFLERKTTNKPIIEPEDRKPDIIDAAKRGDIQRIRDILDIDVSQRDTCSPQDGATPLMFAAMTGRIDIAQLLFERGCDINKQDTISGWTALMQATYHGKKSVAIFLINVGADVTTQAKNGCTAFDMASLIEDADTELLRLLATRAMHVDKGEKPKTKNIIWSKQNGTSTSLSLSPEQLLDDQPKSGLKGWLNRLSNRFRNLKIGRTFNTNNRLMPLTADGQSDSIQDLTSLKQSHSSPQLSPKKNNFVMEPVTQSMTSYETMKQETKKSAALYTLDINPPHSNMTTSDTLKPVIPPFLPPPSFDLDSPSRPWRGLGGRSKTTMTGIDSNSTLSSGHERPILRPMKFLQNHSSYTSQISPTNSARFTQNGSNPSPNSSGDYQGTGLFLPPSSSSTSYTSERNQMFSSLSQTPSRLFMPRRPTVPSAFRNMSNTTSPNSSTSGASGTSGSSSVTPIRSSRGRSTSSKGSTTSTLTPSPSPTPGK
ncbi:ankyrin repeat and SAM domain-containing protein 6-like, partial [Ruditapes philippinarum]|uniref:ankyrin repeat and SAM domain-containing protein 6-like n=1 Tax=Ruditapes philippinarum TaxID=129788 RepID=UPI00295B2255